MNYNIKEIIEPYLEKMVTMCYNYPKTIDFIRNTLYNSSKSLGHLDIPLKYGVLSTADEVIFNISHSYDILNIALNLSKDSKILESIKVYSVSSGKNIETPSFRERVYSEIPWNKLECNYLGSICCDGEYFQDDSIIGLIKYYFSKLISNKGVCNVKRTNNNRN